MRITPHGIIMKGLLVALPMNTVACCLSIIMCIGCRIEQVTNPSAVTIEGIGTSDQSAGSVGATGGEDPVVPQPGEITLTFEPPEVEGAPGDNVNVVVTAIGPNGVSIPSFDVTSARSSNPFIASVSEIDGRIIKYRLNNIGATSAIIKAAGTERSILIWVN